MKRLHIVEEKFLNTVKENNLINENDVIVVGVSGGPDSITLLTCLNKYKEKFKCRLVVAHINHMIRKDANDDEEFAKEYCEKLDIPFYSKRAEVEKIAKEEKKGTEETGRKIRYEFFDEVAKKENANKIAIAHNMNDNAETVLLNLIRGSGINGLEGIQPSEYGKYIRPLIYCKREEIEDYCKVNNLNPRIDSTNKENIYKRNIIRNQLLPFVKEINPNIVETLSRTSIIAKDNDDFIKKETDIAFKKICDIEKDKKNDSQIIEINSSEFNKLDTIIKENLILKISNKLFGNYRNIEKTDIDSIIKMSQNNIGKKYIMINKNYKFAIDKGILKFERISSSN